MLADDGQKYNKTINFYLPHEFGGCGEPQQELYKYFNTFKPEMDLAKIVPRWTTKHDFMVELPKNEMLDEAIEDQGELPMTAARTDGRHSRMSFN